MNLPTSEPLDDKNDLPPARRRRQQRLVAPLDPGDRAQLLDELALQMTPPADFYLFSALAGLVIGMAILVDAPALYVLGALISPFMAPVIGLSLAVMVGSVRYFIRSLGGFLIGSLIVFIIGMLAGYVTPAFPQLHFSQAVFHAHFSWADFLLLTLGAVLTTYLAARNPQAKPLVASAALAYELYIPLCVAGFGLASGSPGLWPDGLVVYAVNLAWVALIGMLVLLAVGLRPSKLFGYSLGSTILLFAVITLIALSGFSAAVSTQIAMPPQTSTVTPTFTFTPIPSSTPVPPTPSHTPTQTPVPSATLTPTISPVPTLAIAKINAKELGGANVHTKPQFMAPVIRILANGWSVEVYPDAMRSEGVIWRKIRMADGVEGWIWESLLITATPKPGW